MSDQNPTDFPKLNIVLQQFVKQVVSILGENVIGIYLQGSHAVGDAFGVEQAWIVSLAEPHVSNFLYESLGL